MFIGRRKELATIENFVFNSKKQFLYIYGKHGVGKTSLIYQFIDMYQKQFNYNILLINAFKLSCLPNDFLNSSKDLLIIDDYYEFSEDNPFTSDLPISSLKKVLELPIAKKVIIVSQKPSYFFNSSLRKRGDFLEIPPLSNQELDVLVGVLLDKGKKPDLTEFYNYFENNPRSILVALNSFNQLNFDTGSEFLDYLNKPIKQSGLIDVKGDPLDSGREETKIITQTIRVVNNSLIEKVNKKPGILFEISPRKFEELVAELLEKEGFNVNLTKQTRDGGKDIFVAQNNRLGNFLYYVECKQYSRDRPVGVNLVRELYGTISADRATAGLLITSSYFTKDAIEFTKNIQHQLSLKGYIDIKKWISEICLNTQ